MLFLAACGVTKPPAAPHTPQPAPEEPASVTKQGSLTGYAFGAAHQDVTLFDPASLKPLATRPLGATVTWLSNEQHFWDGQYIWTYDFPNNEVEAIAVDPRAITVARRIPTGGNGPAHSLMLTPDRATAWLNVAGDDYLAVLDLGSGEVAGQVQTGKFP